MFIRPCPIKTSKRTHREPGKQLSTDFGVGLSLVSGFLKAARLKTSRPCKGLCAQPVGTCRTSFSVNFAAPFVACNALVVLVRASHSSLQQLLASWAGTGCHIRSLSWLINSSGCEYRALNRPCRAFTRNPQRVQAMGSHTRRRASRKRPTHWQCTLGDFKTC